MKRRWVLISYAILASVLLGTASFRVMPHAGGITHGDAAYFWNIDENHLRYLGVYSDNYLGEDKSNAVFLDLPPFCLISFFRFLGVDHESISYLVSFGVVFVSVILGAFIFFRISGNVWFGVFALIFLFLNSSTIEYVAFGSMDVHFMGLLSLNLLIYIFWKIYDRKSFPIISAFFIGIVSLVNAHPFYLLSFLILANFFFMFLLVRGNIPKKHVLVGGIISNIMVIMLNAYWIIPFFSGFLYVSSGTSYSDIASSVMVGFASVAGYVNALSFFQYPNFLGKNFYEIGAHHALYVCVPIFLALPFFIKRGKYSTLLVFLVALHIFFLNLALGPVSAFWGGLWEHAWNTIPFFAVFRSFARFQVVLIPLYLFYFALLHLTLKGKYKRFIYAIASVLLIMINIGLLSGDVGGTISAVRIPREYRAANEIFSGLNPDDGVVAVFPNTSYTDYDWISYRRPDLMSQYFLLEDYLFDIPVIRNRASLELHNKNPKFTKIFSGPFADEIDEDLRSLNVKYVMVQKDNIRRNGEIDIISSFEEYDNYFRSKNDLYVPLLRNEFFALYEVGNTHPVLSAADMIYEKVSPWKYRIDMRGVSDIRVLEFARNYSEHWKLYPSDRNPECLIDVGERNPLSDSSEKRCFFEGDELSLGADVFADSHREWSSYGNMWTIDPIVVKESFPTGSFSENSDGSVNLHLVLFYEKQQSYYYGVLVSVASFLLIGSIVLLNIFLARRTKNVSPS